MNLENLRTEINRGRSLDDLIIAILFMTEKDLIKKDPVLFFQAFQEMKGNIPMPLLEQLLFDPSTIIPWSEELDQALFRLETARLLIYGNGNYLMSETRLQQFNIYLRFSEEERTQIGECAKILGKYIV